MRDLHLTSRYKNTIVQTEADVSFSTITDILSGEKKLRFIVDLKEKEFHVGCDEQEHRRGGGVCGEYFTNRQKESDKGERGLFRGHRAARPACQAFQRAV